MSERTPSITLKHPDHIPAVLERLSIFLNRHIDGGVIVVRLGRLEPHAKTVSFRVTAKAAIRDFLARLRGILSKRLTEGAIVIALSREARNEIQNRKFHAQIGDIARSVKLNGKVFQPQSWKVHLILEFETDLAAAGQGLAKPSKHYELPSGLAYVERASTREFTDIEAAWFIQFLYAYGAELGAVWSDQSLAIFDQYPEAKQGKTYAQNAKN